MSCASSHHVTSSVCSVLIVQFAYTGLSGCEPWCNVGREWFSLSPMSCAFSHDVTSVCSWALGMHMLTWVVEIHAYGQGVEWFPEPCSMWFPSWSTQCMMVFDMSVHVLVSVFVRHDFTWGEEWFLEPCVVPYKFCSYWHMVLVWAYICWPVWLWFMRTTRWGVIS
jgi:hypothetical protein